MSFKSRWKLKDIISAQEKAILEGLAECAEDLQAESEQLCPKRRGYAGGLVSTAYHEVDAASKSMAVGYTAPHAQVQHYNREYRHKDGEQALFVSEPLKKNGAKYLEIIAEKIKEAT